jgi:hypothetical protein
MKYRVKAVKFFNGNESYYPQYKRFLFWQYITKYTDDFGYRVCFNTKDGALREIKKHIGINNFETSCISVSNEEVISK